jgi:hypothetical protein
MIGKRSSNGRGFDIIFEHEEIREEVLKIFTLAAIEKAFHAQGLEMPKEINYETVGRYISKKPLKEGETIVTPFVIRAYNQDVHVPLYIKQTDSQTKILVAPPHGLCPKVIKKTIDELFVPGSKKVIAANRIDSIPVGLHPLSTH